MQLNEKGIIFLEIPCHKHEGDISFCRPSAKKIKRKIKKEKIKKPILIQTSTSSSRMDEPLEPSRCGLKCYIDEHEGNNDNKGVARTL